MRYFQIYYVFTPKGAVVNIFGNIPYHTEGVYPNQDTLRDTIDRQTTLTGRVDVTNVIEYKTEEDFENYNN